MKKIGLVLAGGGSLGSYEVGAVKALRELGFKFDIITGTSIGAINAAMLMTDDFDNLERLWKQVTVEDVIKDGIDLTLTNITSFNFNKIVRLFNSYVKIKGANITPLKNLVKSVLDLDKVKSSNIKVGIVTATFPFLNEKRVILNDLDKDKILPYIHASSAVYPLFPLERIDGKLYIDGGFKNNCPVDFCLDLGADEVIAIDLPIPDVKISNRYLFDLPNVKIISNNRMKSEMMNFNHDVLMSNMRLGYLDTLRFFDKIKGFNYYFDVNIDDELETYLFRELYKKNIVKKLKRTDKIDSYLLLCVEHLFGMLRIPYDILYKLEDIKIILTNNKYELESKEKELCSILFKLLKI